MTTTTRPPRRGPASRRPAVAPAPRRAPSWSVPAAANLGATQLLAALTLLASLFAIDAVLVGSGWWLRPILAVAWVLGIGAVLRRSSVPGVVTSLVQLLLLAILLTLVFGLGAPGEVGELMRIAGAHIQVSGVPAGVVPAVEFVLTAAVGLLAVLVDALAARWPALVAVPAIGVVATGATFHPGPLPWSALVLPGVAYVAMLAASGPPRRGAAEAGAGTGSGSSGPPRQVRPTGTDRAAVVAMGGVAVVIALVATTSASSVPADGRLERTNVPGAGAASPFTGLVGDLLRGEDRPLLSFTSPVSPRYLRTVALTEWTNNRGWSLGGDPERDRTDAGGPSRGAGDTLVPIATLDLSTRFLPVLEGTTEIVESSGPWYLDDQLGTWHRRDVSNVEDYTLRLDPTLPTAESLAADTVSPTRGEVAVGDLDDEVRRIARRETEAHETPFAKALALQQWFTTSSNGFVYSLRVPEGTTGDLLLDFLTLRRGYCEQYASAMAVMLRAVDIPARVVVGFGAGTAGDDGVTTVSSHNAHAWVEVRFDDAGWVRFDPTPSGGGQGSQLAPSIEGLPAGQAVPGQAETLETPGGDPTAGDGQGGQAEPTPAEPTAAPAPPEDAETGADGSRPMPGAAPGDGAGEIDPWMHVGRGEIALILLLLLVTGPQAVRWARGRRRTVLAATGGPGAAEAAWQEIEDLALDHGSPVPATATLRDAAARIATEARLPGSSRQRLEALVRATEEGWFAADAPAPVPADDVAGEGADDGAVDARRVEGEELVRAVTDVTLGLEHHRPPGPWRWWFPPSLRRSLRQSLRRPSRTTRRRAARTPPPSAAPETVGSRH